MAFFTSARQDGARLQYFLGFLGLLFCIRCFSGPLVLLHFDSPLNAESAFAAVFLLSLGLRASRGSFRGGGRT